jgi:hypothetical protein
MPMIRPFPRKDFDMDDLTLVLSSMAACLVVASAHARRLGNEKRDVALLAVTAGLLVAGSAASALI